MSFGSVAWKHRPRGLGAEYGGVDLLVMDGGEDVKKMLGIIFGHHVLGILKLITP